MFKLALMSLLATSAAAASAVTPCGNGNACPAHSTCVSTKLGAGRKWACAPVQNATICSDERYSCPESFSCNATSHTCNKADVQIPLFENGFAVPDSTQKALVDGSLTSICSVIGGYLPSFCQCQDNANLESLVQCNANLFGYDTVTVTMDVQPCGNPAGISFVVSDSRFGIKYNIGSVQAGTDEDFDIPGLSVEIPVVDINAGVVLDVNIEGNIDNLEVKVGIDACAEVPIFGKECGSSLTRELPIWLLDETFNFGNVCSGLTKQ